MEGQSSEGSTKPKTRTKEACDVGCQTDASPVSRLNTLPQAAWMNGNINSHLLSSSSPHAAGSSVSQKHPNGQSSGTSHSQTTQSDKSTAPAGVVPNSVAEYFADKQTAAPGSATNQKMRTSSTTGVVGEGKKCVRSQAVIQQQQGASSSNNPNGSTKSDPPCWEDDSSTLRLVIDKFSALDETMCSDPKLIKGVSWKIMVMPKQHMVQKKQQKCMGFFLQCAPQKAYSDQWSVHAVADMRMISNKPDVQHFARRTTHTYTSKENDWGYSCFMTWADILEDSQGYIKDDCIILEIAVQSEAPKNMISREDFVKKIDNWISLADFQMKKGCIDLAIEANSNAKAFCYGKDDECMAKLKEQADSFDKAKINATIDRLTNIGKTEAKPAEASQGKPTSLRQALTGAQKSLNGKITAKGGKKARAVVTVQHMKKKKPYEQNNASQQRVANSGTATVKDLVEMKKNSKADGSDAKQGEENKNVKGQKNTVNAGKRGASTEVEEKKDMSQPITKDDEYDTEAIFSVSEEEDDDDDDYDEDEEVYNEGDYADQALNVNGLGFNHADPFGVEPELMAPEDIELADGDNSLEMPWSSSCEDLINAAKKSWVDENLPVFQGYNDDGIMMCDRTTQTVQPETNAEAGKEEMRNIPHPNEFYKMVFARNATTDFSATSTDFSDPQFYSKIMEFVDSPAEMSKILSLEAAGQLGIAPMASSFGMKLDGLPVMPYTREEDSSASSQEPFCQSESDKLIRQWLNVEGALTANLSEESVLARLNDTDRRQLLDELTSKLNPMVVALDLEFRDSTFEAQQFLEHARSVFGVAQALVKDFENIRTNFEEKVCPALGKDSTKKDQKKGATANSKEKTATSAAATSGSRANNKGRPTVIAKRSLKNAAGDQSTTPLNEADYCLERIQVPAVNADSMRDVQFSFKSLNSCMSQLDNCLHINNVRLKNTISEVFGEDGFAKHFKDMQASRDQQIADMLEQIAKLMKEVTKANEEKATTENKLSETILALQAEVEKHTKSQKESKDLRTQLKKAENRATKEENRATTIQVSHNEIDEKYKSLRKETETLRKKSTEERAKTKREKDRDTQTIRQQANELSDREKEVDKLKKELEESYKTRDKIDKDRRQTTSQLTSVTDRARNAEALVIEGRKSIAVDLLNKRKAEVLIGYNETEKNMISSRHANDREVLRKSLAEWKETVDKCDAQIKSVTSDHDLAIENVKNGSKTLAQIGEIKLPALEALPKLVKPPPVQVVAPSSSVIPPPVIPPAPAAGVIGQQRAPMVARTQHSSTDSQNVSACSTPSRSRVSRLPSPVNTSSKTSTSTRVTEETPASSFWSWNTIGNLGDLRPSSRNESSFNSSLDAFQRDIWAANGNAVAGLGNDFIRSSVPTSSNAPSLQFTRQQSQPVTQSSAPMQPIHVPSNSPQNINRPTRVFGDIWTPNQLFQQPIQQQQQQQSTQQQQQQQQQQQRHEAIQQQYNFGGLGLNTQNAAVWRPQQQQIGNQLHHQNSSANHQSHNPYSHPFYDGNI